ncbi:MAG: DUF3427 domain-containing protein, partial [Proteobacteria bacterium]|nr:DUF3427 domain-containing protein [Candidatus Avisuccinivibrio stercorigallinarum]
PQAPAVPLSLNHLFAGNCGDNELLSELKAECASADEICLIVSFIKWQGYIKLKRMLEQYTARGGRLYVLTTTYIGATDAKAVIDLSSLPNTTVKICYDNLYTRLHAKAYIFKRQSGFGSAYVGSSNISAPALTSGVEWNVKVAQAQDSAIFHEICHAFDYYFADEHFEVFVPDSAGVQRLKAALDKEKHGGRAQGFTPLDERPVFFELRPYNYQQQILDKLQAQREVLGVWHNLVTAATGTGKTMIAAFDFKRFAKTWKAEHGVMPRFLFIAHRAEILRQAAVTFRQVLRDQNFGELLMGSESAADYSALFASIQSVNSKKLYEALPPDFYQYIIIDEVHHAAADSYLKLLQHFKPVTLLGLTATPDRADGREIFSFFDRQVSASIELPEAIERGLLCPFAYFGVSDVVDLNDIDLKGGEYDERELENIFVNGNQSLMRADLAAQKLRYYADDIAAVKALGFCVSVQHANFMADYFNRAGIKSRALTSRSTPEERRQVQGLLSGGQLQVIFTVDLYNEGVDIPEVNTVLFLRPTHSLTIFLQQLGRGLRRCEGKNELLVLDFIAPDQRNFYYADRYLKLLRTASSPIKEEIEQGFIHLPAGCFIELEKKAQHDVLESISSVQRGAAPLVRRLNLCADLNEPLTLKNFLRRFSLKLEDLYYNKNTFGSLKAKAHLIEPTAMLNDPQARRLLQQLSRVNGPRFLRFVKTIADDPDQILQLKSTSWLRMLLITVFRSIDEANLPKLAAILRAPEINSELQEIIEYQFELTALKMQPLTENSALDLYADYSRDQLLTALNSPNVTGMVTGLNYIKEEATNVLLVTLHKELGQYSAQTLYQDYSIDERTFHWQSPNSTKENSKADLQLKAPDNKILLFVRERKEDKNKMALPYTCLGEASVESQSGEMPISYILKMHHPIPAKFLQQTSLYQR